MKKFTADFETATWIKDETWVWAWAVCEIGNEDNLKIGNNIDSFMEFCKNSNNSTFYFHNLKFDGEFIISWCLNNDFKHVEDRRDVEDKTFTTLISDMGQFYTISVYFKKGNKKVQKVTFIDSLKIIPLKIKKIPAAFNIPIQKLDLDYKMPREKGHILTKKEEDYIKHDIIIPAKALDTLFKEGLNKMTEGSNALNDFKEILTKSKFNHYFPQLDYEVDKDLRKAYKGGFTYLNPLYKEKDVGKGIVLDVNSLYPSVMYDRKLPFGEPVYFEGKYENDKVYDLYIQMITCSFKLKKNKIPTIQIKDNKSFFRPNDYLESSNEEIICLVLTNVDLKLFLEQYDVYDLEYVCGWKFKSKSGIFTKYIDKWITRKIEATKSGNKGQRTLAKLMLNSLYGKFATSMDVQSKIPYLGEDGIVHYSLTKKDQKAGVYLPMGCFITAYAREKTIRTSQAIKDYSIKKYGVDKYIYSDTDSIHTLLTIDEVKQFCDIDHYKLGYWDHESTFSKARFIRQKCYLEEIDNEVKITCAGMPEECYDFVKWEEFKTGFTCGGKLTFNHVKGGVILEETDFTIKEDKVKTFIETFKK